VSWNCSKGTAVAVSRSTASEREEERQKRKAGTFLEHVLGLGCQPPGLAWALLHEVMSPVSFSSTSSVSFGVLGAMVPFL
jgi:hypothetical protein